MLPEYYTDKSGKRLNATGRALFATKYRCMGMDHGCIARCLNIPVERLHKLYGNAVGLLGYFGQYPEGTQAEDIIEQNSADIAMRVDIIITRKGKKLFTSESLPSKVKNKKEKKPQQVIKLTHTEVRNIQYDSNYKLVIEDRSPEGFQYLLSIHGREMISYFPSETRCFVLKK